MISVIFPVYKNEEMLLKNLEHIHEMDCVEQITIVYDGYVPEGNFEIGVHGFVKVKQIRNHPDVPWGISRARNLGAMNSDCDWLLFLDVDHTLKESYDISNLEHTSVYKFKRLSKEHPEWPAGSLLMHRTAWQKVGGYDERFDGHYGYEDLYMLWILQKHYFNIRESDMELIVLNGGQCKVLDRDSSVNEILFNRLTNG